MTPARTATPACPRGYGTHTRRMPPCSSTRTTVSWWARAQRAGARHCQDTALPGPRACDSASSSPTPSMSCCAWPERQRPRHQLQRPPRQAARMPCRPRQRVGGSIGSRLRSPAPRTLLQRARLAARSCPPRPAQQVVRPQGDDGGQAPPTLSTCSLRIRTVRRRWKGTGRRSRQSTWYAHRGWHSVTAGLAAWPIRGRKPASCRASASWACVGLFEIQATWARAACSWPDSLCPGGGW